MWLFSKTKWTKLLVIILHSTMFCLFYAVAMNVRIFLPPESVGSFLLLSLALILAFLSYPLITGLAFKIFDDIKEGKEPSLRGAFLLVRKRYLSLLGVSAAVIGVFVFVAFIIFLIFGDNFVAYFKAEEAKLRGEKFAIVWQALLAYGVLFLLASELPPILFPVGILVLFQPSSDYFFAGNVASIAAVLVSAIPVAKCGLWLPHALFGSRKSIWSLFREAYTMATPSIMRKLLWTFFSSVGAALGIFVGGCGTIWVSLVFMNIFPLKPMFSLGRWPISLAMIVLGGFFILIPGIASLRFYRKRVSIYREALEHFPKNST